MKEERQNLENEEQKHEQSVHSAPSAEEPAEAAEPASMDDSAEVEVLQRELEEKSALADEYLKRLQRLQADFENFRRRTSQEATQLRANARLEVFQGLLPVLDNLQRAVDSGETGESLLRGLSMIERQFNEIMMQSGIEPIEAVGHPFDPRFHEAVQLVDSTEHQDNEIVQELQKGYRMGERVLRVSMVIVARRVEEVNADGESNRD